MKWPLASFRPVLASVSLAMLVCLVAAATERLGLLEGLELQGYDLLIVKSGYEAHSGDLVIVDFDDATTEAVNEFPIPRRMLVEVLERIATGEPALVGLDLLLSEERSPVADERLAAVLGRMGNVILANNFGSAHLPPSDPLLKFRDQALDTAFVNLPVDRDGLIRRMFLWVKNPDYSGVSFPVSLASNYWGAPLQTGRPGTYQLGKIEIPLDQMGPNTALIGFSSSVPSRVVPVNRLLASGFSPGIFKKKIVLVGQSSAKAKDLYATPMLRFQPSGKERLLLSGTEIHAAALATLLSGKTIRVLGDGALWSLNLLLAWLIVAVVMTARPIVSVPGVLAAMFGSYLIAATLFGHYQIWMKLISTEAGILLALPAGLGYRYFEERRFKLRVEAERQQLMGLFERYVSPEAAAEIWERRNEIVLAGQEKTATVLFSDIRNFTGLSAGKPSVEVLTWLNRYFTAMSEVVKENGGFLNKFIGDGMLVVFGVPLSDGIQNDACRGVRAALEMLARVQELNARHEIGQPMLRIGIGLHTGLLTAGNVGAQDRLEYSVIGETVNLASRLESLNKQFSTSVIMSEMTRELVKDQFEIMPLGDTAIRGFASAVKVYTVRKQSETDDEL